MIKILVILLVGLLCLGWAALAPASKDYWEGVGPSIDRALNPIKYD